MSQYVAPTVGQCLLGVVAAWYVGVLTHELGHYCAGRLAGFRMIAWGIGIGKPLLNLRLLGSHFFVARRQILGGVAIGLTERARRSPGQLAILVAGGPLVNLLEAAVLLGMLISGVRHWLLVVALLVAWCLLVVALLPVRMKTRHGAVFRTDGMQLLQLWRGTHYQDARPGQQLGNSRTIAEFCRDLDAWPGVVSTRIGVALQQAALGDGEAAQATLKDCCLTDPRRGDEARALEALARAQAAFVSDEATSLPAICEAESVNTADPAALAVLARMKAVATHAIGMPAHDLAVSAVDLATASGFPDLVTVAQMILLRLEPPADYAEQAEALLGLRGARKASLIPTLSLLAESARILAERGEDDRARSFFVRAQKLLLELSREITDEHTRAAFLHRYGRPLLEAVRAQEPGVPYFAVRLPEEVGDLPRSTALTWVLLGLESWVLMLFSASALREPVGRGSLGSFLCWLSLAGVVVGVVASCALFRDRKSRKLAFFGLLYALLTGFGVLLTLDMER